jgi:hypothetical protein
MKSLYRKRFFRLASLGRLAHHSKTTAYTSSRHWGCVMLFDPKHDEHLAKLEEQLRCIEAVTAGLMSDVIAIACVRFGALGSATKVKVKWLIEAGAWTDATIALLGLELPQWKLRRLVNEDGKWLCSLSKQPWIPLEYDAVAEASHESLPLAILIALLKAQRSAAAGASGIVTVRPFRRVPGNAASCDNFV